MRRIGIDVGGTFTDVVVIDEETGAWSVLKRPSTPDDPSRAVIDALDEVVAPGAAGAVRYVGHGTTVATNAFLTRSGAEVWLITSAGFEDVLEFRRMDRSGQLDPYDLQVEPPQPLVPGRRRVGVAERVGAGGDVVVELTDDTIRHVTARLAAERPSAVAVSLLWAFANPSHERALVEALKRDLPECFVTASSDVDPEIMEYERTSTTVLNAYLGPLVERYLRRLGDKVAARGLPAPMIMQSNGGVAPIEAAGRRPVALLESGPAGGVAAAAHLAGAIGIRDALAVDMGGTSFDVALIVDGEPQEVLVQDLEGYALRVPMIDIRSIGAGGGSIAHVDDDGVGLGVGPRSAGSVPGPAAYGRGGEDPTVTDANVVLGVIQQDGLAGGSVPLVPDRARSALASRVGAPLGLSTVAAARAVRDIVDAHMANAMRIMALERGLDVRGLDLIAYGGSGPLHAASLARDLEIGRVIIPAHPGAMSALGVATADVRHDFAASVLQALGELEPEGLEKRFATLEAHAVERLTREGFDASARRLERSVVARYIGQLHDLEIDAGSRPVDLAALAARFHEGHRRAFGFAVEDEPILVMTIRLRAYGRVAKPALGTGPREGRPTPLRYVPVALGDDEPVDCPLYLRRLWDDEAVRGPAVIQQYDATTVVLPGQIWRTDATGSIVIEEEA